MVAQQFIARPVDWPKVRDAFIRRPERPTYAELAGEFDLNENRIKRCAADEGWTALRASHLETQLQACNASQVLLSAVKIDQTIVREFSDAALIVLGRIKTCVEGVEENRAASTNVQVYNTATFALANLSRALKDVGIVGIPKGLADGAQKENGRWNPQLLSQINLTVQNLSQAKDGPAKVSANPTPDG